MLEVAICDDDKEDLDKAALVLDKILSEYHVKYQIRSFLSANELLNSNDKIDIGILDISMEELGGITLGRKLKEKNHDIKIIYITSYEEYMAQTEKYNQTVRILHDVDKHIRAIENLYGTEREHTAGEYAEAIRSTLAPLIPISYTENSILNILLTDKNAVMQEKGIHSDIKIDNVELSYIEPIDITTIFGNLLDNAIEATANAGGEKYIFIKISAYHKMTVVHIENSCGKVKWKKRMPVSDKGKGRGIGLLNVKQSIDKYDGDLQLKQDGNRFVADLFLNS